MAVMRLRPIQRAQKGVFHHPKPCSLKLGTEATHGKIKPFQFPGTTCPELQQVFSQSQPNLPLINFCLCLYLELFIQHWRQQTYEHLHASDNIGLRAEDSHCMTEVVV